MFLRTFFSLFLLIIVSRLAAATDSPVPLSEIHPSPETVRQLYGPPTQVVAPNLWIYWNFPTRNPAALRAGYDTLVVRIEHDEVVAMRLVNRADLRALLAAHATAMSRRISSTAKP